MAGDSHQAVRQLVATTIATHAEPKYIDVLIKLVNDDQIEVAGQAANGPKLEELAADPNASAAKEARDRFLTALKNGIGGEGLVLALDTVVKEPEATNWFQTEQIFKLIQILADPRAGDALDKWGKGGERHPHWKSEVGMRLAEIGDIRAVPYLAERMSLDPEKLYPLAKFWQHGSGGHLSKTDNQRVWAARMLADLAMIHPDKKEQLLAAETPVFTWLTSKPQPHANGLRYLATVQSEEAHKKMQEWAFTDEPLPKENHTDLQVPHKWATAQSALRYIGRWRKEEDYKDLEKYLNLKKDKKVDITQAGLMDGGKSMMGMVLRAAAYGAAQGIGEWGDPKGVKPLTKLIEDETWHEEARVAACEALAWCATPEDMKEIANKAVKFNADQNPKKLFIGACYTTTLSLRPMPEVTGDLVTLMTAEMAPPVRNAIAQAIGSTPLDKANTDKLFEKMKTEDIRNASALALILGGDTSTAARAVAMFGELERNTLTDFQDAYFRAFGFWSDEDFKRGNLYRWVENAEAIARVKIHGGPQMWAIERLQAQFENLEYDNGPHSETRVVLRQRIMADAKGSDTKKRDQALQTLRFMKEQGVLMALMDEKGDTGVLARKAFHELMHPTPIEGDEKLKSLKAEQAKSMKDKKD
jgi:HEAT repeat protein